MFPFTYKGETYSSCTEFETLRQGFAWCAIKVDRYGKMTLRENCAKGCPGYTGP